MKIFWHFVKNIVPNAITEYNLRYSYNIPLPQLEGHNLTYRTYSTIINRNLSAVTLIGLRKYTTYCIQIVYITRKDEGGSNGCTYAKTHEDGEYSDCFKTFLLWTLFDDLVH
jgi:hypothetical protein